MLTSKLAEVVLKSRCNQEKWINIKDKRKGKKTESQEEEQKWQK